ncbi:MAG: MBL fold metallo-hydrolase [Clostridia bacterium]|nr:MBL fold metallo-hydrolase [Clostridia bacterium]
MKLHTLIGNTELFRGGTNSGLYHLSDSNLAVIDPGLSESRGRRFSEYAQSNHKRITHLIGTHEHSDHIGALSGILCDFPDCHVLIDHKGKHILESPDIFLAYINGGAPNHELRGYFRPLKTRSVPVHGLSEGPVTIGESTFEWFHFGGHSVGSAGVITPDGVLFLGDTLIPSEILSKFKLPLLYSVDGQYHAFNQLENTDYELCVTGHGKKVLTKPECIQLAVENRQIMEACLNLLLGAVKTPQTKEALMAFLIDKLTLTLNYKEYLFGMSSVSSLLSYLIDKEEVTVVLENNHLLYKLR